MVKFLEALCDELALYVRQNAWLDTSPENPEGSNSKAQNPTRRKDMEQRGVSPDMPLCSAVHIIGYLYEIGPTESSGLGQSPISHSEIESWQNNTGIELNSWESRTIRQLSIIYSNECIAARDYSCPAPHTSEEMEVAIKENVGSKLKSFFANAKVKRT